MMEATYVVHQVTKTTFLSLVVSENVFVWETYCKTLQT